MREVLLRRGGAWSLRCPCLGDTSIANAMTSPTTGQSVHCPPNQCCTTEYQSSVVGRKMKPRINQSAFAKRPLNQFVKNQSRKIVSRGAISAMSARKQGTVCPSSGRLLLYAQFLGELQGSE